MGILSEIINGKTITVTIESSNLSQAIYDTEGKTLSITFKKGGTYIYEGVSWELFTKFRLSKSQGKFFIEHISKNFKFKKLT